VDRFNSEEVVMMHWYIKLDAYVLERVVEPRVWLLEYRYGIKRWDLFSFLITLYFLGHAFSAIVESMRYLAFLFLMLACVPLRKSFVKRARKEMRFPKNTMNPEREKWYMRLAVTLFTTAVLGTLISTTSVSWRGSIGVLIAWLSNVTSTFVLSCNQLPPGWSCEERALYMNTAKTSPIRV
jgi:hypothetical protein